MNTTPPTFLDLIERLTRTAGSYTVYVPNMEGVIVKRTDHLPGLLEQLRTEVFLGMEGVGGSSSFGSRPPIDAGALDLLTEITDQATEALASVTHTPIGLGHAERYVALWAAQTTEHTQVTVSTRSTLDNAYAYAYADKYRGRPVVYNEPTDYTAMQLAQRWCDRIEDFFNPPALREIPFPCPDCSAEYVHRSKDGQHVRSRALNFVRDRDTGALKEARCGACGMTWAPAMFERLAVLIGGRTYAQVQAEWAEKDAAALTRAAKRARKTAA